MALSTVFLGLLLLMVAFQRRYIANRIYTTVTGRGFSTRPTPLGRWRYPAFALVLSFALVITVLPTISVGDRHVHEAIWLLQYCRTLDLENWRATLLIRCCFARCGTPWPSVLGRDCRHIVLFTDCLRYREDPLSWPLAARFSLGCRGRSRHSSGSRAALDLCRRKFFTDLRNDLSFDGRHGDQKHALRHADDQERVAATR